MAVEKLSLKIHIFFALLGLFAGVLGFMVFVFGFNNYHAGEFQQNPLFHEDFIMILISRIFRILEFSCWVHGRIFIAYSSFEVQRVPWSVLYQREIEIHRITWTLHDFGVSYRYLHILSLLFRYLSLSI